MPQYKAVVDIGTNSFHMIIAEVDPESVFRIVHDEKKVMRLGTGGESALKHITADEKERSVELLKKFCSLAEFYSAETYVIATSAVRESDNSSEFKSAIKAATGLEVNVIDGNQEAAYIYLGVKRALPVEGKKVLCIDIGGGSTEIIIGTDGDTDFVQSYKLGAVRLSKMFFPGFTLSTGTVKKCSEYISDTLKRSDLSDFVEGYEIAVGTSGTIQAIAAMTSLTKYKSVPKDLNGFSFTSEDLKLVSDLIMKYPTVEERSAFSGIETGRADILPAGTLILSELFSLLDISSLTISTYALREGFLIKILSEN